MLPAEPVVPTTRAAQVARAEAARIAAVLQAALSRATIVAYALRLDTYAAWAAVLRGHVDIALVRTMRDGIPDELAHDSDGSARLHITRSKTDQEARGLRTESLPCPRAPLPTASRRPLRPAP